MKLYELGEARDLLDGFLAETEGEETSVLVDLFADWQGAVEAKVEATALYLRELDAEADAIKAEEQRLSARRKAIEGRYEGLKGYLAAQMERMNLDKVKTPRLTVAFQNAGASLVVDASVWTDERIAALRETRPDLVTVQPETVTLDRRAVLTLVKAEPEAFPGLSLRVPRSLRIR